MKGLNALQKQKHWSAARVQYEETLRLQPGHSDARTNLDYLNIRVSEAWMLYEQGNRQRELEEYTAAVESYRAALEINPRLAEAYNNLGVTLGLQGEHRAALQYFEAAVAIAPDYQEARTNALRAQELLSSELEYGRIPGSDLPE